MKRILRNTIMIGLILSSISVGKVNAQKVGDAAPDFSLKTLDNKTFTLSEQKGKVVFIFLFGNNCPHCLANAPNTQSIYETFKSNPDFVSIGVDVWNGSSNSVQSFKNRTGLSYPIALDGAELTSKYSSTYDRILIVDKEGKLHYKASSNATTGVTAIVKEMLESLLMGGATGIEDADISNNSFNVYPNPIFDQATIQTDFQPGTAVQVEMIDMTGKVVQSESLEPDQSGNLRLNLENHPVGIYYLRAKTEEKRNGMRVILAR